MKVDLHIHSNVSDGKLSPSKIVDSARKYGLGIVSLTDHDTVDGVPEALETAQRFRTIQVIPHINNEITLNDSCIMTPGKSISGIFGLSEKSAEETNPCTICPHIDCPERR